METGWRWWNESSKRDLQLSIGLLALGTIVWWLATGDHIGIIVSTFQRLKPWQLAGVSLCFGLSYLLRAIRIHDEFRSYRLSFAGCLRVTLVHNAMVNIFPFRGGEASFPLMMNATFDVPLSRALASLVWFRIQDLVVVAILTIGILPGLPVVAKVAAAIVICLAAWTVPMSVGHLPAQIAGKPLPRVLEKLRAGFGQATLESPRGWVWTGGTWVAKLGGEIWLLGTLLPASTVVAAMGVLGAETAAILPVQGVAGFGTYEAGASVLLTPMGIPLEVALNSALAMHLLVIGFALIGAVFSTLIPAQAAKSSGSPEGGRK